MQQTALDSLAGVVLDNRIMLDYFLEAQGEICAIANTSYWINTSSQVELETISLNFQDTLRGILVLSLALLAG